MRERLQDKFTYGGGKTLPTGCMGNTVAVDVSRHAMKKNVPARPRDPKAVDPDTGLNEEQYLFLGISKFFKRKMPKIIFFKFLHFYIFS